MGLPSEISPTILDSMAPASTTASGLRALVVTSCQPPASERVAHSLPYLSLGPPMTPRDTLFLIILSFMIGNWIENWPIHASGRDGWNGMEWMIDEMRSSVLPIYVCIRNCIMLVFINRVWRVDVHVGLKIVFMLDMEDYLLADLVIDNRNPYSSTPLSVV